MNTYSETFGSCPPITFQNSQDSSKLPNCEQSGSELLPEYPRLLFDGGEVKYKNKSGRLKGSFLFTWPYKIENLDNLLISQMELELHEWVRKTFIGDLQPGSKMDKVLKTSFCRDMSTFSYICFRDFRNEYSSDEFFKVLRTYNKDAFTLWIWDDIVDEGERNVDMKFYTFLDFVSLVIYKILCLKFESIKEIWDFVGTKYGDMTWGQRGKIKLSAFDMIPYFHLYLEVAQDLKKYYGFHGDQLKYWAGCKRAQLRHVSWLDKTCGSHLRNSDLRRWTRYHTSGCPAVWALVGLLNGVYMNKEILTEQHLRRLEYVGAQIVIIVNDIYSFKKDALSEEVANEVIQYLEKGFDFDTLISKMCRKHDELLSEFQLIYQFLSQHNDSRSNIIRYANFIVSFNSNIAQLHLCMDRYAGLHSSVLLEDAQEPIN